MARTRLYLPEKHRAGAVSGAVRGLSAGLRAAGNLKLEHVVVIGGRPFLPHCILLQQPFKKSAQKLIVRALKRSENCGIRQAATASSCLVGSSYLTLI